MLGKKIILNNAIRKYVSDMRKSAKESNPEMTADNISIKIGRAQSWLSQVENGRLKSVKTKDLVNAFMLILNNTYENSYEHLDNKINDINTQISKGIMDNEGNIIDFSEYLIYSQIRGYLYAATKEFNSLTDKLISCSSEDITKQLKNICKSWKNLVVDWIVRAFKDTNVLFSNDEVSMINLYNAIENSYHILIKYNEYYGLNKPNISNEELLKLKEKLSDTHIVTPRTCIKPLNEYSDFEIEDVIQYFSPEEYMTWKNHQTYMGQEPFPMLVNYKKKLSDKDHRVFYDDITHQKGLTEEQYLHIINQLCFHFDLIYKYCKHYIESSKEYEEESNEYFEKTKQLQKELEQLKSSQHTKSPQD